jgi:two-component system sensor histidine kinase CiaH
MFHRARLQLTAWYAGALALVLLTVAGSAYLLVRRSLDDEINKSINLTRSELVSGGQLVVAPSPDRQPRPSDDDFRGGLVQSDVFYVTTAPDGTVLSNPRRINLQDFDFSALTKAASSGDVQVDISVDGHRYRVDSQPIAGGTQYVHIARSLDARDQQLSTLAWVMGLGGAIGLVLSTAGGFWLAGRTLTPIRDSLNKQRQFVSDASHELRTPVAVIRANNDLLIRHPEQSVGQNQDVVEAINDEAIHMTRLIEDLLTLARADEGRLALQRENFNLTEMLADVARGLGPVAESRHVKLSTELAPAEVTADRQRLRQTATILLDNALKYTPAGGCVVLRCGTTGKYAEFSVCDTGPGIAPADQHRIFDRFARVGQARARADGGTGLGLAIARTIAEAHGGGISVDSTPGKGSTFTVRVGEAE